MTYYENSTIEFGWLPILMVSSSDSLRGVCRNELAIWLAPEARYECRAGHRHPTKRVWILRLILSYQTRCVICQPLGKLPFITNYPDFNAAHVVKKVSRTTSYKNVFENAGCKPTPESAPHGLWSDIRSVCLLFDTLWGQELIESQLANAARQQSGKDHSMLWVWLGCGRHRAWKHWW